ncbi:MAG: serine hydrolase [Bacteroidia bacterium]|jgi:beta-lactamase class A
MTSKTRLLLGSIFLSILTFGLGYFVSKGSGKPISKKNDKVVTASSQLFPYLNPISECIRQKGMNVDELMSFRPKIEQRIDDFCKQYKGVVVSYYFRDLNNGLSIGINEKQLFSPASLMKVPILIAVLKEAETNPGILDKAIQYNERDFSMVDEEAGIAKVDGNLYPVNVLLEHCIMYSDNRATLMLMALIGKDKLIKVEDDLNLHIKNEYTEQTNFVSVKHYAGVFRILYNAAYLNESMSERALELMLKSKYAGGIRKGVAADIRIAHKYGERDIINALGEREAIQLHHFGLVYHPTKPFILGVMTRGPVSKVEKEKLISDLSQITYNEVELQVKHSSPESRKNFLKDL